MYLFLKNYARFGLLICMMCFADQLSAQIVSLTVQSSPLEQVFLQVEKQTGFSFIYSSEALKQTKPVTIQAQSEQLETFLKKCLKDQPLEYQLRGKHIVLRSTLPGAPPSPNLRELRGRVTNEQGDAMPGITIAIKGSAISTYTNADGEFTLPDAPQQTILLISGAEIQSLEVVAGEQPFVAVIVRARIAVLDETVVIGYGKTTRRLATGTIEKLGREKISQQPASNPLSALTGRITGLQITQASGAPGTNFRIRLRGQNSIANGNNPLFIVDGVPFPSQTLNGLFGGGASSTSNPLDNINPDLIESIEVLKDADATAIFGSRGANGVILITTRKGNSGKPSLNVKYYQGFGSIARRMDLLNTKDYITMRREAFANDGRNPTRNNAADLVLWDTTRYTDWQDELIGNTMQVNDLNVSLTGGSAFTQFTIGGAWRRETTVFPGDFAARKYSGSMSVSHSSQNRKLSISASSSFMQNNNLLPREDLSIRVMLPPNAPPIFQADGQLNWEQSSWLNPIAYTRRTFENRTGNFLSNLSINYRVLRPLTVRFTGGYSRIDTREHSRTPTSSYNPATGMTGSATFGQKNIQTLIGEPQLVYSCNRALSQLEILGGMSLQQTNETGYYHDATGYSNDAQLGSIKAASRIVTAGEEDIRYRYAAFFARASWQYKMRYLLSATWRRDGSSRYGPANRFAHFGSAGVGWIFTKEHFARHLKWLSFGKIKASIGTTGNDQIGDYRYLDLYAPAVYTYQDHTVYSPVQLYNPAFGWEKVTKREAGVEIGILKDRFIFNAQYYHNTTDNQLVSYALPATTGFSNVLKNIPAKILNNGWELQLTGTIIKRKRFGWTSQASISFPGNKLLSFQGLAESSYASYYVIGKPLSIEKTYAYTGVNPETGVYTFTDVDRDGTISIANDQATIVNTTQSFFGGLEQSWHAGRFTASLFVHFVRQPYAPNYIRSFGRPGSMLNQPAFVMDRWQAPGQETAIQKFTHSGSPAATAYGRLFFSDGAFSDASFIRLRNLYLSWQLLTEKWKRAGISDARIFLQGQNLLTISGYKGLDPETQTYLPPIRMVTAGIQFQF